MIGNRFVTQINGVMQNKGIFRIGSEEQEVLLDEITRKPIIPASGIAGAFRAYAKQAGFDEKQINSLFGCAGNLNETDGKSHRAKSKLFAYDAYGERTVFEKRQRVRIEGIRGTADTENKGKFSIEFLNELTSFPFQLEYYGKDMEEMNTFDKIIINCLAGLHSGEIRFGGQKTNGAGEFTIVELKELKVDMFDRLQYVSYLTGESNGRDILGLIKEKRTESNYVEFKIRCVLDTPLLIGGLDENDSNEADKKTVKNVYGEYIIPASSLKGVIRSQCSKIADFVGSPSGLVEEMFGSTKEEGCAGRVYVSDSIIHNHMDSVSYHRIKIDKFTGGTLKGAKFSDKPVMGDTVLSIRFLPSSDAMEAQTGLLILALRDLAYGITNLGSGFNIGRGRLKASGFYMRKSLDNKEIYIDFDKKTGDFEALNQYISNFLEYGGVVHD